MPIIEAILWDLDDTLINTTITRSLAQHHMIDTIVNSLPSTSSLNVDEIVERAERLVQLFGSTYYVQHISLLCHELVTDPALRQHLIAIGCKAFRETFWQIKAVDGAKETLQRLKEQGYKLGLVSNGLYPVQLKKLTQTGLDEYFDRSMIFISSHYYRQFALPPVDSIYDRENVADPVELEHAWLKDNPEKPWPLMLELALEQCNCLADRVIYVGDRVTDFFSARSVGIWSVQVTIHSSPEPPALLSFERPHYAIESISDIFLVINQIENLNKGA